jgi:hypothetical protein
LLLQTRLCALGLPERSRAVALSLNRQLEGKKPLPTFLEAFDGVAESVLIMNIVSLNGFVEFGMRANLYDYQTSISWRFAGYLYDRRNQVTRRVREVIAAFADTIAAAVINDGSLVELVFQMLGRKTLREETVKSLQLVRMQNPWIIELARAVLELDERDDIPKYLELTLLHYRFLEKRHVLQKLLLPPYVQDILDGPRAALRFSGILRRIVETPSILPEKGKYRLTRENGAAGPLMDWQDLEKGLTCEKVQFTDFMSVEAFMALRQYLEYRLQHTLERVQGKSGNAINYTFPILLGVGVGALFFGNRVGNGLAFVFIVAAVLYRNWETTLYEKVAEGDELEKLRRAIQEETLRSRKLFKS